MKKRLLALLLAFTCTSGSALTALAAESTETELTPVESIVAAEEPTADSTEITALEEDPLTYRLYQQTDDDTIEYNPPVFNASGTEAKTSQYSFLTGKTYQVPSGYNIFHGIDVSYYNGVINWSTVKNAGVDYAIIRVGYRGYGSSGKLVADPKFDTYMQGAASVDMPVGVYIFSQAITTQEAIEEANFVLEHIKGYNINLPIVMDYEFFGSSGRLYDANLSKSQMTANALAFCNTIKEAGYKPMLYANKSFLTSNIYADTVADVAQIWLANYTTNTTYTGEYDYWQYAEYGSVDGVSSTYVDSNFLFTKGSLVDGDDSTPTTVKGFTDVLSSSWYASAISFAVEHNLMSGISSTTFAPNQSLNRAMVAQILYNLAGKPSVSYSNVYSDVAKNQWYTNAVMWAKQNGVMVGIDSTTFGTKTAITREQLATTLYSFSKKYGVSVSSTTNLSAYTDASKITSYAVTPMKWAVANGLLSGRTSTTLVPKGTTTRAECAAILKSYLTGIGSKFL